MVTDGGVVARLLQRYGQAAESLAEFFLSFVVLYAVGRFVVEPLARRLLASRRVDPTLRRAVERVVHAGVVLVAVGASTSAAGYGHVFGGSAVVVAGATVALGFAARDVIGNFVSGVFIVADSRFNIGDWIEWDGKAGVIDDITFRTTSVRTFDNEIITVPNSQLTESAVTNPVISDTLRITYTFEVAYDADLDRATDLLLAEARDHAEVLDDPEPTVVVADLGDSAILLEARLWIADPKRPDFSRIRSDYLRGVTAAFEAADLELNPPSDHDLGGRVGVYDAAADGNGADGDAAEDGSGSGPGA